jgi:uncharacterized repeat protein (TIGR02543 family)
LTGTVTLTASLIDNNYTFDGWGGDCASNGTNPTCTLKMLSAKDVVAYFDPNWSWDFGAYSTWDSDVTTCSNYGNQYGAGTTGWHMPSRAELTSGFSTNALGPQHNKAYWSSESINSTQAYQCTNNGSNGGSFGIPSYLNTSCFPGLKAVNNNNIRYARCKR